MLQGKPHVDSDGDDHDHGDLDNGDGDVIQV